MKNLSKTCLHAIESTTFIEYGKSMPTLAIKLRISCLLIL